jgi:hypothetical protein
MIRRRRMIDRLADVWLTDTGNKVRLQLMDAPEISQSADFMPRRIVLAPKSSLVKEGSVVSRNGDFFLLVGQSTLSDLKRFRALEITHWLPWKRNVEITDPVSKMRIDQESVLLRAALPVVVEPMRTIKEQGFDRNRLMIWTGEDVQTADFIGDYEIHSVMPGLGVKMLEAY